MEEGNFTGTKKILIQSLQIFSITYIFLFILNAFFPTQSDDFGRTLGGIKSAINSYLTWNGRLGELFLVSFGSYFSTTPFYALINAFIGSTVLFLLFYIIFDRFPKDLSDISIYCIIVLFIMIDPCFSFGSVFYWAAGSFNYLYSWFYLLFLM